MSKSYVLFVMLLKSRCFLPTNKMLVFCGQIHILRIQNICILTSTTSMDSMTNPFAVGRIFHASHFYISDMTWLWG